jgi:hypothetical protein
MVITPAIRGLLGIEVSAGGKELRFAPQLPANWNRIEARNVAAGDARYDLKLNRAPGRLTITITRTGVATSDSTSLSRGLERLVLAPAFPLDARIRSVKVQQRATQFEIKDTGDVQRAELRLDVHEPTIETIFTYEEGTEVYLVPEDLSAGAQNTGLRIIRAHTDDKALHLVLEGRSGHTYTMRVRTPYQIGQADGVTVHGDDGSDPKLTVAFEGPPDSYVRRDLSIPIQRVLTKRRQRK